MFDSRSNASPTAITCFLLSGERCVTIPFPLKPGPQPFPLQLPFDRLGTIGRIRPYIPPRFCGQQELLEDLTIMHGRIRPRLLRNEPVRFIHVHRILIPVMILPMLDRPACLYVLLPVLGRLVLPFCQTLPCFNLAFSSRVWRCWGTGTSEASINWPPRAWKPWAASYAANCAKRVASTWACAKVSRNNQMVLASRIRYSKSRPKNRRNDRRARI